MKESMFELNTALIKNEIRRSTDYHSYARRCKDWIRFAIGIGISEDSIRKVYDEETDEIIFPNEEITRRDVSFPYKKEWLKELLYAIKAKCSSIVDSYGELSDFDSMKINDIYNKMYEWTGLTNRIAKYSGGYDDFVHNWLRLWQKKLIQRDILINTEFYIDCLQEKISLDKHQRALIKRLDIDYRYRLTGMNNNDRTVTLHFLINDVRMNVHKKYEDHDEDTSYTVPYGIVNEHGKAESISIKIVYRLHVIARAIVAYTREAANNGVLTNPGHMYHYSNPFTVYGSCHARTSRNRVLKFPFIEGWGNTGRMPCWGSMDEDIMRTIHRMDFVSLASMLRAWVSNFTISETSPFQQPNTMHAGIPREFGSLAIVQGQDTSLCKSNWINTTKDCEKIDCVLMENGTSGQPKCPDYRNLFMLENQEREDKKRRLKQRKRDERVRPVTPETQRDIRVPPGIQMTQEEYARVDPEHIARAERAGLVEPVGEEIF